MGTKNVEHLLSEGSGFSPLQTLLRHNANQRAWTDQLRAVLDDGLKYQVAVSDIKSPRLIVNCRSAGVATKLRFVAPDIIAKLTTLSAFCRVEEIVFNVLSSPDRGPTSQL